jgi:hypothetical protein
VARDSDSLVFFARDLERLGEYGLSAGPGRRAMQGELHGLTDAAEFFRASLASGSPRARLARDFADVEGVWERVAPDVARLTRPERQLLAPRADRVGDAVLKLHRRLGLTGTPPRLVAVAEPAAPVRSYGMVLPASPPE